MSVYALKPAFQNLLRPVCRGLARRGVTANQITLLALGLSLVTGLTLWAWRGQPRILLLLPLILFVRMALNALDGMLAREHAMKTPLGALLNELGDVLSDAALYLPLAAVPGFASPLVVLLVVLAVISEMSGVLGLTIGAQRRYDGPLGKSDRAFAFGLLGMLLGVGVPPGTWLTVVLAGLNLLLVATILRRTKQALAELEA